MPNLPPCVTYQRGRFFLTQLLIRIDFLFELHNWILFQELRVNGLAKSKIKKRHS